MKKTFHIFSLLCLLVFSPMPLFAASTDSSPSPAVLAERLGALQQRVDEIRQASEGNVEQKLKLLEAQQRNVDLGNTNLNFWSTSLVLILTILSIMVAVLAWLLPRKERKELRNEVERARAEVERAVAGASHAQEAATRAANELDRIRGLRSQAENYTEELRARVLSSKGGEPPTPDVVKAATELVNRDDATIMDKLRAEALLAEDAGDWAKSLDMWRALARLQPKDVDTLFGQAHAIQKLVEKNEVPPSQLEEAARLYKQVGELEPEMDIAFYNWGHALSGLAKIKSGEEAERLFREAGEKYARAIEIKPDDPDFFDNWSTTLLSWAQTTSGIEREALLNQAFDKAFQAETLEPGQGAYNLACVAALRGQEAECREWLGNSKRHGELPDCAHLKTDPDLDFVRELPWFQELLREVYRE